MNLVATLKYRKTLRGSRSRIAGARRNGKEVCRAHFVQTVTFRRLCPPKELSDGQSESSVFRQGSFNKEIGMAWNYPDGCGPDDYEKWCGPDPEDEDEDDEDEGEALE